MPFIPRGQHLEQTTAQPPSMPFVEPSTTDSDKHRWYNEQAEQIAELNELLVHVLDEISSLKEAMYQNTRRDSRRPTKGAKGKRRHVTEEESDEESGESEAEEAESKGHKKAAATTAVTAKHPSRRGVDFSGCF